MMRLKKCEGLQSALSAIRYLCEYGLISFEYPDSIL